MTTVTVKCFHCEKPFEKAKKYLNYNKTGLHFCSIDCLKTNRTKTPNTECSVCKKPLTLAPYRLKRSKSGEVFCSHTCSNVLRNAKYSGDKHHMWKGGSAIYRKAALAFYGIFCHNDGCLITKAGIKILSKMLDVHHIDGDRSNNLIENLEVLCVWCHALKTRNIRD